ncbi:zinc finger protein 62 homolog [Cydia pomonella]|uniref:zinc finger protein 62 homolog n=1 Tax=Cydia pomonella TaxID=82600 RepID=UPI002ADDFC2D|nr:zinc finger protein 62 homolog [Cydia pomonella]
MSDIKLEPEDLEICRGCLSSNRRLSTVETAVYLSLLTKDQIHELDLMEHIALCWECMALLRKTSGFGAQVQKAHMILQDSLQLLPTKPTLSSLSVHRHFEYDAVFEESTPPELPIFYEPRSAVDHDKVIVPTKYKTEVTKSDVKNLKTVKVILHDIFENNIKSEHDSDDNENFEAEDIYISSEEMTKTKTDTREILRKTVRQNVQDPGPKITKEINNTAILKLKQESQKIVDTKKVTPKRRQVNTAQTFSVKIVKHTIKHGKNKSEIKVLRSSNIDNKTKLEVEEDDIDSDNQDARADLKHYEFETQVKKEKQPELHTNIKLEGHNTNNVQKKTGAKKKKHTLKFRKLNTKYKKIEEVLPYFQEIEMNEQDLKSTLEKDDAIVDKHRIHKCSICGVTFQLLINLKGHALRNHKKTHPEHFNNTNFNNPALVLPQNSVWRCDVCARMMRREHIVAHMNEFHVRRFLCNGCEWSRKPFWKKEDCQRHWNEIHKQLICDICEIRRKSKKTMEFHIEETHMPNILRQHQCPHCPNSYSDRKSLLEHDRQTHQTPEPVERRYCAVCDVTFRRIEGFQAHFRNCHSGIPKKRFPCPQCDKVLTKKIYLKRHTDIIHAGISEFRCHICGKYLCKKMALQRHLDMHNNIKRPRNHACNVCGHTFMTNSSLQFHMNTHTGERPYKCTECQAAFTQPYTLRMHLAKHHNVDASVGTDGTIVLAVK